MATFTPPADTPRSPIPPGTRGIQRRLFKYFTAPPAARNVYILTDNTVVQEWPATTYNPDTTIDQWPSERVARTFFGGHGAYPVNSAESALLIAAGYTIDP